MRTRSAAIGGVAVAELRFLRRRTRKMPKWSAGVVRAVPSTLPDSLSRRDALAVVGTGSLSALAGCSSPWSSRGHSPPERRVAADWHPERGEWPVREYDYARTRHNPFAAPPRDDPTTSWTYTTGGSEVDSLVVAEDAVFVRTTAKLAAVAHDGDVLWEQSRNGYGKLQFVAGRLYDLEARSLTALRPDGAEVWSADFDGGLYRLVERDGWVYLMSHNGTVRLHADTGAVVDTTSTNAKSPRTTGGPVYTGTYSLAAYDVDGGEFRERWARFTEAPYEGFGQPMVANGRLYQPELNLDEAGGRLAVYDTTDGSLRWALPLAHRPGPPTTDGERLYVSTSTIQGNTGHHDGRFVALSLDGDQLWEYAPDAALYSPVLADGVVYVGPFSNDDAPLVALDTASGEELWRRPLDAGIIDLAVAGETLYVSTGGTVRALEA